MTSETSKDVEKKWQDLTERLIFGTSQGKLNWDDGPFDDSVITDVQSIVVMLRKIGHDYWITLSDQFGNVVDVFSDRQVPALRNFENTYTGMDALFRNAKRQITGADGILDLLLSALPEEPEDDIPF